MVNAPDRIASLRPGKRYAWRAPLWVRIPPFLQDKGDPMKTPIFELQQIDGKNRIVFEDDMPENLLTYLHVNCGFESYPREAAINMVLDRLIGTGNLYQEDGVWKCRIVV